MAINFLPNFIGEKFGESGFQRFLENLSAESRELFTSKVMPSEWYPIELAILEPSKVLCDLFYNGDKHGLWEVGRFSASHALRGVYKIFVKMHDPMWAIRKSKVLFANYYRPGEVVVADERKNFAVVRVTKFPEKTGFVEQRMGGWNERALEIGGVRDISVTISKSFSEGDPYTEFTFRWS